ncbi:MAG: endonuclease/exonuclease/phosphatase family protein [Lachnospiraceae bacterium]|nr:endonuclease/exonuclease/phosphatase family protein [Lachnospiraceae bacterium]
MLIFFRYYLLRNYGYKLEIVSDTENGIEYEILIGNTVRTTETPKEGQFVVFAGDFKLQLIAADMQSYEAMYEYMTKELLKPIAGKNHVISEGFVYAGEKVRNLETGTRFATERPGDVRCMFYNVYGYKARCGPIAERQGLQEQLIKTYMPDVLAFQEYSGNYHSAFTYRLRENGYCEVEVLQGENNYTPLFYRKDRLKVMDSGYLLYEGPNDVNSKSITWAVFEMLESGKQFIAMSNHFMYNQSGIDANAARVANAKEAAALIAKLRSNDVYKDIPMLFGGDLNCNMNSEPVEKLTENGLVNAWKIAEVKNDSSGHHDYTTYNEEYETYSAWDIPIEGYLGATSIDHVFVSENTLVKSFATLMDMYALIASDHLPELVQISLK